MNEKGLIKKQSVILNGENLILSWRGYNLNFYEEIKLRNFRPNSKISFILKQPKQPKL